MKNILKEQELAFVQSFNYFSGAIYRLAQNKGWWKKDRNQGEIIALIHSELSEALETLIENKQSDKIPKFLGIEEELADTIIRIMDYSEGFNYKVAEAIIAKLKFNYTRKYKHGGKEF